MSTVPRHSGVRYLLDAQALRSVAQFVPQLEREDA